MDKIYPVGKLPTEDLDRILQTYASGTDDRVLVGPGVGQDAAVISFGTQVLVAKTDPITFATDQIGWYAVHINANDIAATSKFVFHIVPATQSQRRQVQRKPADHDAQYDRSEEHTSELQ